MTATNPPFSPHPAQSTAAAYLDHLDVRVVVFSLREDRLQVLLAPARKTGGAEAPGAPWELPGSLIPTNQSLEETAIQCVLRLTGLREAYLEQLYTYGEVTRTRPPQEPPRAPVPQRVISVVYFAIIPAGSPQFHGSSSFAHDDPPARWFPVDHLPSLVIDHEEIVAYALVRLRYKLEYSAVGFQLLPEQFSLSELQKVYEIILGEELDKRNFRRRILQSAIIEETNYLRSGEGRPARLYHYRPDAVAEIKTRRLFP